MRRLVIILWHFVTQENKDSSNEIVAPEPSSSFEKFEPKSRDKATHGRKCVVEELIKTEKDYIRDLSFIIDGYINIVNNPDSPIRRPESFNETRQKLLFGNIEHIYKFHKK